MATKAEQLRQKKKKNRERKIKKNANIRRYNLPEPKYRLDVLIDDVWRLGVMTFRTWEACVNHQAETERRRAAGEEIAEGRISDMETGKIRMVIVSSKSKGDLPDKLAGNPEAAAKAVIDNHKVLPDNLKV